jgi:hypothetical protein
MSIFIKDKFSLKELCDTFSDIKDNDMEKIINCYLLFSSGNAKYKRYLNDAQKNNGIKFVCQINNRNISFREVLQRFDDNFNKVIIRIRTIEKDNDIIISWEDIERNIPGLTKEIMENLYIDYKNNFDMNT